MADHRRPEPAQRPTKPSPQQTENPFPYFPDRDPRWPDVSLWSLFILILAFFAIVCCWQLAATIQNRWKQRAEAEAIEKVGGIVEYRPSGVEVSLFGESATDEVLVHLQGLGQVQSLRLDNPNITDAGLVHLQGLSQLQTLDLTGSRVTDEGVRKLQRALPNCYIHR
jgi:hypothetical protein